MSRADVFKTAYQSLADPLEYIMSDDTTDRMGDVIDPAGWDLGNFKKNPIALFNHRSDEIIGFWSNVRREGNKLIAKLNLADAGTSPLVDKIRRLVEQRILRACSVGFRSLKKEKLNEEADDWFGPFKYLKSELVECSLVSVPANPNALQVAKSVGISDTDVRQFFSKPATEEQSRSVSVPGKPAPLLPKGKVPMKLAQKIQAAQTELNRLRDQLTTLSDNDEPTEDEIALQEQLPAEIETAKQALERLQRMEKALAVQTVEGGEGGGDDQQRQAAGRQEIIVPDRPFRVPAKKLVPSDFFIRAASIFAIQKITQQPLEAVRRRLYGEDESTAMVLRAVTNPGSTTVPGWAQELVQTAVVGFLDLLTPNTIFPVIRSRGGSFTFGPGQGNIRVPGRAATPQLAGAWVGEGQPIPVRRIGFTSALLTPKKLAVISTFTHELADYSTPNIEAVIRDAMRVDTSLVIDTHLLDDQAATAVRPPGLRNGVAGLTPSALTDPTQAMIADIKALVGAIIAVNGGRDIVIVMNSIQEMGINFAQTPNGFLFPSEGEAGRRFNVTFASSTAVTPGLVMAIDASEFASASGDSPEFNVSDQATIHEEDTAPLPIATGPQGTAVPATPVRSLWQTDTIGIRMRMPLNWAMRRPGMVSWMTGVLW